MKKLIKLNDGYVEMSFEEVLTKHNKMLYKLANSKQVGIGIYKMDVEEIVSELNFECWKCFKNYSAEKEICFSTVLYKYCVNRILQLIRMAADKQEYLAESDEYDTFDIYGENDNYFEDGTSLIDAIAKTERERQIMILLSKGYDKRHVANTLGIARSGMYKTLDKIKSRTVEYLSL